MKTNITAKNMVVTPGITNRVLKKTQSMSRYLKPETEMNIRLRREKEQRIVEITVPMDSITIRSEASSDDNLFQAIDKALAKLEKQILRHRTKLEKRLREDVTFDEIPEFLEHLSDDDAEARSVVREKVYTMRPMSREDAIMQMDLLGHSFYVYIDVDTEDTHVLYLRNDGNLGILVPEL